MLNTYPPSNRHASNQRVELREPRALDGSLLVMRGFCGDDDLPGLCQLFSEVFGHSMDVSQWRWKYMSAPGAEHYHALAAHAHTGQLLGHMGVIVVPGVRGGQAIRMAHATDLMVSPLARTGLGGDSVYRHIMHAVRERALAATPNAAPLFMYGFPGQRPATLAIRLGIQRRLQICTEYATAPVSVAASAGLWARLRHLLVAGQRNPLRIKAHPQPSTDEAWSDAVLDSLWQKYAGELALQSQQEARPCIAKTGAYLRWRYLHHPLQHTQSGAPLYTLWLVGSASRDPLGWLVTREHPQPTVVDSCLPMDASLMAAALQSLPPSATGEWVSWLPHPGALARPTPIWATAMQGSQFYDWWPSPAFQPGDTDVF